MATSDKTDMNESFKSFSELIFLYRLIHSVTKQLAFMNKLLKLV